MAELESEFFIDYSRLDDFQLQLIDRKSNKPMVVTGSAGSGKSLIALHKARRVASMGSSYAIIVYTTTLRKFFSDGLKTLGLLNNVYNYHQWEKNKQHVKYLIVDECQDFTHEEIEDMRQYGDICFFFGDSAQTIMNFNGKKMQTVEQTAYALGVIPEQLYFNYTLTKAIAALAEKIGKVEDLVIKCKRDGEKTNLIEASSYNSQLDRIAQTIKNRSLTNVGILMPFNTIKTGGSFSVEYVKDYLLQKGITCEFKYRDNEKTTMDLDFHSSNPKVMTWWCAKGLRFKDVFIPGCDQELDEDKRAALYVAMTRCSERLYLGFCGHLNSFFPEKTSTVFKNSENIDMV